MRVGADKFEKVFVFFGIAPDNFKTATVEFRIVNVDNN
jgi:hypothetical protein